MTWIHGTWAIFLKDVRLEYRTRYALNLLLMFVVAALLLVLFAIGQQPVSERVQSAVLWIVILFASVVSLGRTFVSEEERGTVLLLQLNARPSTVYAGKLVFNFLLVLGLNTVAASGLLLLLGVDVANGFLLISALFLGALGLSGGTTLLAAIIARTANPSGLLAVLMFPVLVPLLLPAVKLTQQAILGVSWSAATPELLALVGYAGAVISASTLLFDYVWNE